MEEPLSLSYSHSTELQLFMQLKSWIAINPSFGCIWDCAYCIQHKDKFFNQTNHREVKKLLINNSPYTPEDIFNEILANPRITPLTPLTFYNFSDPFLPQNSPDLIEILKRLDEREASNIVGLISKTLPEESVLDEIADLENLSVILLVSYAGYEDKRIETVPKEGRIELAKKAKSRKIPVLHYFRPIVKEWIKKGQLEKARDDLGGFVDGVVMSGIRLTPEIIQVIRERNLPIPQVKNYTNKFFPREIQEEILHLYKGVAPVYRYTSCGVSSIFKIPDYNAHLNFLRHTQRDMFLECPLPCRDEQKRVCEGFIKIEPIKIRSLLERINQEAADFREIRAGMIILNRELPKEDLTYLRHNTSLHIDYEENKHHIDQIANLEVKSQK